MADSPDTILSRLVMLFPEAKKTTLREMLESKRVHLNGVIAKSLKQPVTAKDKLEVVDVSDVPGKGTTLAEGLIVIHFDRDIVIVDKPSGLLTATDAKEKRPTAWRILSAWFKKQGSMNKIHLVHRLDRDASGLLVFARNWDAYTALKKQFFEHTITRRYDVLVHGIPKKAAGRLENLLFEDEHNGRVRPTNDPKRGKEAVLDYEMVATDRAKKIAHLKCTLLTGRKHQIRVQLQLAGHAVCGDPFYGVADEPPGRLALHASHLIFEHPRNNKPATFESKMPGSFGQLLRERPKKPVESNNP